MSKIKDEVGNRYGRLVVIERAEMTNDRRMAYWLCKCDCGNTKIARGVDLRCGGTRSCGCLRVENGRELVRRKVENHEYQKPYDMIGKKYGHLLVLRRGGRSTTGSKWVCQCDCGNIVEVRGNSLRSGNTTSCGCSKKRGESKSTIQNS